MKLNPSADEVRKSALSALAQSVRRQTREELESAGWFTAEEVASEAGESRDAIDKQLRKRVRERHIEMQKVSVGGRPTVFFRLL